MKRKLSEPFLLLSISLFLVSLALPVERAQPGESSPLWAGGLRGWQLFIFSFVGLANTETLSSNIGEYLFIASGAAANLLFFAGWLAPLLRFRSVIRIALASTGVILALASLTQTPWQKLAIGYWVWLASAAALLLAAVQRRRQEKQ